MMRCGIAVGSCAIMLLSKEGYFNRLNSQREIGVRADSGEGKPLARFVVSPVPFLFARKRRQSMEGVRLERKGESRLGRFYFDFMTQRTDSLSFKVIREGLTDVFLK